MKVFTGNDLDKIYPCNKIQEMLYDAFGIPKDQVKPSFREKNTMLLSLRQVNEMDEEDFYIYFTLDPVLIDEDEPKSSFKDTNKKMKAIEEKAEGASKVGIVTKDLTFENYLKSTTPKSSFREANKKMKKIEDEQSNR